LISQFKYYAFLIKKIIKIKENHIMQINETLKQMLISRHYLITNDTTTIKDYQYLNAYLLANFGIEVDKPELLNRDMIYKIDKEFHLNVPKSFYNNPQDLRFFSKKELIIEQLVSYFAYGSDLGRIELFKKNLPEYIVGDELKLRNFYIVTEEEAEEVLSNIMDSYCAYTRPFSIDELGEFNTLFEEGYYSGIEIKCKDNIFTLLNIDVSFACFLDKKDIVKLSIQRFGDGACFKQCFNDSRRMAVLKPQLDELASYIPYVKHCPMSKKQAKYFNKIVSLCHLKHPKMTNAQSPDKRALKLLSEGDVLAAARIYAENGSMLERRIKMLLSRANPVEAVEILNLLPAENPIVLYQLMSNLSTDNKESRTFTFFHNNKVKTHRETEYETKYRKSNLNEATCKLLKQVCLDKIKDYYKALPNLGNIYIADRFYNLGMPTNTSASGKGIDVLPTGSRIPCTGNSVRTFVHWKDAFDIDSSLIVVDKDDKLSTIGWFSYGGKPFGNDILFSGDITGYNGAEYFDIDLDSLATKGYKYVVQTFHGYCSKLNSGEIYAGYQNKENLKTKAWDPKNIEMQFKVFGNSRACVAFAIDIQNREVIVLNQILDDDEHIVNPAGFKTIEKYLQPNYLDVNIGMIAECRGNVVLKPEEADVVFDDTYTQEAFEDTEITKQAIIRSYDLEKLVAFINN
jgi:hypothetical protein